MAITTLFGTGALLNLLERATVATSGTVDPDFPLTNAYDGRPNKPVVFSGLGASEAVTIDLSQIENGDFEAWTGADPDGWTVSEAGTADVTETTVAGEFHGGTSAAKLAGGDSGATIAQTFTARPGERRRNDIWLKCNTSGDTIRLRLQNQRTRRYLNSSLEWQATATFFVTHTGTTAYTHFTKNYVVESLFACDAQEVDLTFTVSVAATNTAFADDAGDWPGNDALAVLGLSVDDRCEVQWETGTSSGLGLGDMLTAGDHDDGFGDDQKPNLYLLRSPATDLRYHRVTFENDTVAPTIPRQIGEIILCQLDTLGRNWDWGYEIRSMDDSITNETTDGSQQSYLIGRWPRRALGIESQYVSQSQMRQVRDELWGRARGRRYPVLVIPDNTANLVIYGHMDNSWSVRRRFNAHFTENSMGFVELPFASTAI